MTVDLITSGRDRPVHMCFIALSINERILYNRYGQTLLFTSIINENHDLAIARSSSSRADPGLRVAFKCLNV